MDKAKIQEDEYEFPYHHIPTATPFSQARLLFWGYEYTAYLEKILQTLSTFSFESLIDYGCGDGRLLTELARTSHAKLVGTDFSIKALGFARAFAPSVTFVDVVPPHEHFDFFTLIEVLEHVPSEEIPAFLEQICASLSVRGRGIITVPSVAVPVNRKHYQHFSEQSLRDTLERFFVVDTVEHLNQQSVLAVVLSRLLSNRFFILNYQPAKDFLYRVYKTYCLQAESGKGSRLLAIVSKKPSE